MARILVIDDDFGGRTALSHVLRAHGHEVCEAGDGEEGLEMALGASWHLVMLDVFMPRMNGAEVLVHLRQAGSDLPVVVMSGGGLFDAASTLESFGAMGVRALLPKPFDVQTLLRVTEEILAPAMALSPAP